MGAMFCQWRTGRSRAASLFSRANESKKGKHMSTRSQIRSGNSGERKNGKKSREEKKRKKGEGSHKHWSNTDRFRSCGKSAQSRSPSGTALCLDERAGANQGWKSLKKKVRGSWLKTARLRGRQKRPRRGTPSGGRLTKREPNSRRYRKGKD